MLVSKDRSGVHPQGTLRKRGTRRDKGKFKDNGVSIQTKYVIVGPA